jgi:hypothetical protein
VNASNSAKQLAIRAAMEKNPRADGESARHWARRIAPIVRVSPGYIESILQMDKNLAIGARIRAQDEAAALLKRPVIPFTGNIGPVKHFTNWLDVFHKFQMTAVAYLLLAQSRNDAYATAYLKDLRDLSDRAATRATMSKTN